MEENHNTTQCELILDYLFDHGGITPKEAENELGIMRLASRIHELKKEGYPITDEWVTKKNRFGIETRFKKYTLGSEPIDINCNCYTCKNFSRAYLHHLFKCKEVLALRLAVIHNLYFYNSFFKSIRKALDEGNFLEFYKDKKDILSRKI